MKQIEVLFEELDNDRVKIIEIKNVANFKDLPPEYIQDIPTMGIFDSGDFVIFTPSYVEFWNVGFVANDNHYPYYCSKSKFNELIKTMKMCGENYARVKKTTENHRKRVIKSIKI
jgi:hypothetical protein